jgi:histidinol-phosphate/aromatic aminotransferase/cobyric acid decarboxylase-like protein
MERDRIYARLTSIPNVISRPSPADYVVFEVADPNLVHRRLVGLGIPSDTVQKYPKIPNGMRVFVRSAKRNEAFLRALELAAK